jgi:guanosine-3',5'-bis(diphosphate) 3'-pyrophosphohydrolase
MSWLIQADEQRDNQLAILDALTFAIIKHRNQKRKGTDTPYIVHPIDVMKILVSAGVDDVDILRAALLHDTVEDTDTTQLEILHKFGSKVSSIVAEVTDNKSLSKHERKILQIQHAKISSKEARLVKLADKISNLTDLTTHVPPGWSKKRVKGYFIWSCVVYRAGLQGYNRILDGRICELFDNMGVTSLTPDIFDELFHEYIESMKKVAD